MAPALVVENVSKRYRLPPAGAERLPYRTLREDLVRWLTWPARRWRGRGGRPEDFWALRDVSFEVEPGDVVGLIGRNGAGKSTLLKVLSRITKPTAGRARLRGRVGSLLEVGVGFHPELTGRENIDLCGVVLGMSRAEVRRKFAEIVAFAEVERFLDLPVKRYSSGMYLRLAFAVAAHLETEILLVDEALAVGDAAFQKRCLGKMGEVARCGRTVLFVSHNMASVRALCGRAVLLDRGRVAAAGPAEAVITRYTESIFPTREAAAGPGGGRFHLRRVALTNDRGELTNEFAAGEAMTVEVHYSAHREYPNPIFWVTVYSQHGPMFAANMFLDNHTPAVLRGDGVLACRFRSLPLLPQAYTVKLAGYENDGRTPLVTAHEAAFFDIVGAPADFGLDGPLAPSLCSKSVSMVLPYEWRHPDGRVAAFDGLRLRGGGA
jgi:lipopolysaccharide transport system ATP-binding protein